MKAKVVEGCVVKVTKTRYGKRRTHAIAVIIIGPEVVTLYASARPHNGKWIGLKLVSVPPTLKSNQADSLLAATRCNYPRGCRVSVKV